MGIPSESTFGVVEYRAAAGGELKNNKINKEESLFPNRMMIPPGKGIEKCSCGNLFDIVTLESRNPVRDAFKNVLAEFVR